MAKLIVEKTVGTRNQRKDVENDEKGDGTRQKCCDAERGNIEVCCILQGGRTGTYVVT